MNAKLERTITEIGKTKEKIAALQEKQRTLEQQKIELENVEIVALFRKERLTEGDFLAYIKSRREADAEQDDDEEISRPASADAIDSGGPPPGKETETDEE